MPLVSDPTDWPRADWFRASAPYIRAHRGRLFVVMLGADALASPNLRTIVHDLALLHVLGVRLTLVHGISGDGNGPTSPEKLTESEREAGVARSALEALFSTGIPPSPLRNNHVSLVGGNLVTAMPLGVVDGIDHMASGEPRRIHVSAIRSLLDAGHVVLLSPLGYSASGAAYTLRPAQLAATAAVELGADKLVVFDAVPRLSGMSDVTVERLQELLAQEGPASNHGKTTMDRLQALLDACRRGVPRGHLVGHNADGALLQELFTAEGAGTQVGSEDYRVVRDATDADIGGIVELITPLEQSGALVARPRDRIEREIGNFLVAELDGALTGCCALYPLGGRSAELACLVGGEGVGERLLKAVVERAKATGVERLFALTTRAGDWFTERGFAPVDVAALPGSRKAMYNYARNSNVLCLTLRQSAKESSP